VGVQMSRYGKADDGQRTLLLKLELDSDAEPDEAERLGRQLRVELTQLDIEAIDPAISGDAPKGSKGGAVDWGALLVTFSAAGGVFTSLIAVARDWLSQHRSARGITMTIDNDSITLDRASGQERQELISAWVRRHSGE
jgi:Effector Associated Constant Component 1